MMKNIAKLEAVAEGKVGHLFLEHDTSLNAAKEMCFQYLKSFGQIEDAAKAQQEAEKAKLESTSTSSETVVDMPKEVVAV